MLAHHTACIRKNFVRSFKCQGLPSSSKGPVGLAYTLELECRKWLQNMQALLENPALKQLAQAPYAGASIETEADQSLASAIESTAAVDEGRPDDEDKAAEASAGPAVEHTGDTIKVVCTCYFAQWAFQSDFSHRSRSLTAIRWWIIPTFPTNQM